MGVVKDYERVHWTSLNVLVRIMGWFWLIGAAGFAMWAVYFAANPAAAVDVDTGGFDPVWLYGSIAVFIGVIAVAFLRVKPHRPDLHDPIFSVGSTRFQPDVAHPSARIRPLLLEHVCRFAALGAIGIVAGRFIGIAQINPAIGETIATSAPLAALFLVGVAGLWQMRRWGVWVLAGTAVLGIATAFMNRPSVDWYYVGNVFGVITVMSIGARYYRLMR